ncbi:DUF885 family protein [bacterium]|nr:DUF885 family protein [bacterium]
MLKKTTITVFALGLLATLVVHAAEPSFDQWADQFAADWARAHPQLATRTQYFEGAEQDAIDRRLVLDRGVKAAHEDAALARRGLNELKRYPDDRLSPGQRISAAVIRWTCEQAVEEEKFARHKFMFEHFRGVHVALIHFLTTVHPIRNERDAENYLVRLARVGPLLDEGIAEARAAATAGFLPPKFIVERSIEQIDKFTANAPDSNPFVTTLNARLTRLDDEVSGARRRELVAAAETEVSSSVLPAYQRVRDLLASQLPRTTDDAGIWRLPDGKAAYAIGT